MLPKFPNFKKLELSDREDVEKITNKYPPYSDFNFVSMWSWDTKGEIRLSQLNGNLVTRFSDYINSEPFYSFLGDNKVNETAEELFKLSKKEGLRSIFKLIPEDSTRGLNENKFEISEDKDNFDYLIQVATLKEYNTHKTRSRRKSVQAFLKEFNPRLELIDISKKDITNNIIEIYNSSSKNLTNNSHINDKEFSATIRSLKALKINPNMFLLGVYIDSKLVAYCLSEKIEKYETAIAHFWRAKQNISSGLYAYLMQGVANQLDETTQIKLINIEQDLGIPSLRTWKNSYGSNIFLKKYIVFAK